MVFKYTKLLCRLSQIKFSLSKGVVMQLFMANAKADLIYEPIMKLDVLIKWQPVEMHLRAEYSREIFRKGGREPYDYRAMVKALLIARWYALSYPKLERALRLRLDFLLFCGFDIADKLPSASTLNRFNARLNMSGALDLICDEVESQLKCLGVVISPSNGAIVDFVMINA
jgi:IS5 family transposase